MQHELPRTKRRPRLALFLFSAAAVFSAGFAMPRTGFAAEILLSGSGSFKPPSTEQLAALPPYLGFSRADLASGNWSFSVRYDDSTRDADPDPSVGRYIGSIRAFRLVIGNTSMDLPIDQAQLVVSDGGGGFPNRESIQLTTTALIPSGLLRLSWIQVNQQPKGADLRGAAGVLPRDSAGSRRMHVPSVKQGLCPHRVSRKRLYATRTTPNEAPPTVGS
ncbi:MAG: hypothetical protein M1430_09870, partial [Betaproteobacteria bacterium]|nr:hypothetical protein [Betaproteobacteria bacterium]